MKKTIALVLAMAMSLSVGAFAAYSWYNTPESLAEGNVFCNLNRSFTVVEKGEDGSITIAINRDCSTMDLDDLDKLASTWLTPGQQKILADVGSTSMLSDELSEQYFGGGQHVCLSFPADSGIIFVTSLKGAAAKAPAYTEPPEYDYPR